MFRWTENYDAEYQCVLSMAQMKGLCIYFIEKKLYGPKNNTFRVIAQSQKGEKCSIMSIFVGDLSLMIPNGNTINDCGAHFRLLKFGIFDPKKAKSAKSLKHVLEHLIIIVDTKYQDPIP